MRRAGRFARFWASGGAKFPKMRDSLTKTRMNHRAKFDAAITLSSPEKSVTVQTNKQTHKKQTVPIYPYLAYRHVWVTTASIFGDGRISIMPIIREARAHARVARAMAAQRAYACHGLPWRWRFVRADSSDFGLLGEHSPPK